MQQIHLSIPKPCQENWQAMTPSQQGRFCNACAKEVIDFSTMTDHEVLNYFVKKGDAKVCGRFIPEQLDKPLQLPVAKKWNVNWYWNYAAAFLLLFSRSSMVNAQSKVKVEKSPVLPDSQNFTVGNMLMVPAKTEQPVIVSGRVTDEQGNPIPFATVRIKRGRVGTMTNNEGVFKLSVSPNDRILEASAAGYRSKEYILSNESQKNILLQLAAETRFMGGEVIVMKNEENNACTDRFCTAQLQVSDEETGQPVKNAKLWFTRNTGKGLDTGRTDRKGIYKLRRIPDHYTETVTITAEGYKERIIEISTDDFNHHKEVMVIKIVKESAFKNMSEVVVAGLCVRRKAAIIGYTTTKTDSSVNPVNKVAQGLSGIAGMVKSCTRIDEKVFSDTAKKQRVFRLGGAVSGVRVNPGPLLIVDGLSYPENDIQRLNPNDVASINVLKNNAAMALYGSQAINGVIVVTTKKQRTIDSARIDKDSLLKKMLNITEELFAQNKVKVFPNPVQKGQAALISLQLKQEGKQYIQVSDLSGKILTRKELMSTEKSGFSKIQTGDHWPAGIYLIQVFDVKNKLLGKSSLIVE